MPETIQISDEIGNRANEIYATDIRDNLSPEDHGRFLAIDVTTGEYAIADEILDAGRQLRERQPDAVSFILRVGYEAAASIGYGSHK